MDRSREQYRPGDAFPNVGYVRQMTGRDAVLPDIPYPVVGLIGKKRSGKDTFAQGLIARGATRFAFADPLKEAALELNPLIGPVALPGELAPIRDVRLADAVDRLGWEGAKEIPEVRRTLQQFGIGIRAIDEAFWVRVTLTRAVVHDGPAVITDVRFPNEAKAIADVGGILVRIDRPGLASTDTHISETALDGYPADLTVTNSGTADDLIDLARTLRF